MRQSGCSGMCEAHPAQIVTLLRVCINVHTVSWQPCMEVVQATAMNSEKWGFVEVVHVLLQSSVGYLFGK